MKEKKLAKIFYADLWGLRDEKYDYLLKNDVKTTNWQQLKPTEPYYFFVPKDFALQEEYSHFWKITDIFKCFQIGLMSGQDEFFIDTSQQALKARILALFNQRLRNEDLKRLYRLNSQAGKKTIAKSGQRKSASGLCPRPVGTDCLCRSGLRAGYHSF